MFVHPWYALIVAAHVLCAVVGFAALGATGAYARAARRAAPPLSEAITRFFRPGHNLAGRALYLVPVFGGIALGFSHDAGRLYPYVGLAIWIAATGIATGVLWPAEATVQRIVAADASNGVDRGALEAACRRCEWAATTTTVMFVAAVAVMVWQP